MNKYSIGCQGPGLATCPVFMEKDIAVRERYTKKTLFCRGTKTPRGGALATHSCISANNERLG